MNYRPRWSLLGVGAVIVLVLFTYPSWRRFFTGHKSTGPYPGATDKQLEAISNLNKDKSYKSIAGIAATVYIGQLTSVPAPTGEQPTPVLKDAQPILNGAFKGVDALRVAKGDVTLYRSADGTLLLRFDNFAASNGPSLQVYLSANSTPQYPVDLDAAGVSRFPVGALKGNQGNQQFNIPKELPIQRYRSVVVLSDSLGLIYAIAPLS